MATTRKRRAGQKTFPQRGEIYLTALDRTVGHEIKKTRPALVIQNDISNQFGRTTIVAAITSRISTPRYPNEVIVHPDATGLEVISTIRLDQIRTVDRQRLIKRLGKVGDTTMQQVDDAIKISLGLIAL
jgi:mRNA interferase MazF